MLIELLIFLAILGLVMAVTAPALRPRPDALLLETTARELTMTFALARSRAIVRNSDVDVAFDMKSRTHALTESRSKQFPDDIGITLVSASTLAQGETKIVRFFASGRSSGAEIELSRKSARLKIDVNWLTGAAVIQR